ncbi:GNAT family N-acetyltransferase [Ammonicoccus fulvus]|uniref:GNAT family N-acetyltransferase n=1 Tax=Ammonicoccus fulvus TaxID=3138240 RepID=A0ABZ3FLS4_9ACTN
MQIALATPDQYARISAATLAAYAEFEAADEAYRRKLGDSAARAAEAELWVALDGDRVLGSVTRCPVGSPWRQVAGEGEGEFRMLAVDPAAQGSGVGVALVRHVLDRCRAGGDHTVVLSTSTEMLTAHGMYARLGFTRMPERDWSPVPGVGLLVYGRALDA